MTTADSRHRTQTGAAIVVACLVAACGPAPAPTTMSAAITEKTGATEPLPNTMQREGLSAVVPAGWTVRISPTVRETALCDSGTCEQVQPLTLAAGTFPWDDTRDTISVIRTMRRSDVFVTMFEYGSHYLRTALMDHAWARPIDADTLLARTIEGAPPPIAAVQQFFTERGRTWMMVAAVGSYDDRAKLAPLISEFLAGVTVQPP